MDQGTLGFRRQKVGRDLGISQPDVGFFTGGGGFCQTELRAGTPSGSDGATY